MGLEIWRWAAILGRMARLCIGWTTLESMDHAESFANRAVEARMAACAQVSGPVLSIYRWQGTMERAEEYRVVLKFPASKADEVREWVQANHPYDTPQWVAWEVDHGADDYIEWACRECED